MNILILLLLYNIISVRRALSLIYKCSLIYILSRLVGRKNISSASVMIKIQIVGAEK